ncbi:hypothetical protein OR1_03053 [Geobacter sp. OR-1]|uniref:hypothetical protein n=1 Tax=Geobacter sp. OR-1 TaxID=1266765 RepID=UPI0005428F85|nr:hypothetical protein [Geobacter sp. OR-1]GAM10756.1 hypothetical protein OR1_03053 [Geobacter sp. OR-1]
MENIKQRVKQGRRFRLLQYLFLIMIVLTQGFFNYAYAADFGYINDKSGNPVRVQINGNQVYDTNNNKIGQLREDGRGIIDCSRGDTSNVGRFNNFSQIQNDDEARRRALMLESNSSQAQQKYTYENMPLPPKSYNYKTAKQYQKSATQAYKNSKFLEGYFICNEAIIRANRLEIKATNKVLFDLGKSREVFLYLLNNQ